MSENIGSKKDSPHVSDTENRAPKQSDFKYVTIHGPGHLDNLDKRLIGRIFTFELSNGKMITGKLAALGMYDLVVVDSKTGWSILIMKSGILTMQGDLSPAKR
ncbi:MAG: hypothetical protein QXU98_12620 [Candidatus Parvarchaeota archaeon]